MLIIRVLLSLCFVTTVSAWHRLFSSWHHSSNHRSDIRHPRETMMANAANPEDEYEPSKLIDGKAIAAQIRLEVAEAVIKLADTSVRDGGPPIVPGLAVILVGERHDSATYVRMKKKACAQVGIVDYGMSLPASCSQAELLASVDRLNRDERVHGILVQLPLPPHIDEQAVLEAISVRKDVDGLHPLNLAALATTQTHKNTTGLAGPGTPGHDPCWDTTSGSDVALARGFSVACTPLGCLELLDRSGVQVSGASVVVIGRSNMVGVPLAMLLMQRDATVTMVHSKTKDPAAVCAQADILVVAVGRPELVGADWVKEGAVVIDVGINSVEIAPRRSKKNAAAAAAKSALFKSTTKPPGDGAKTSKLVGDVKFDEVLPKCSAITPVPGGVGPMTIAMLLRNTLQAARRAALARADNIPGHDWGSTPLHAVAEEERDGGGGSPEDEDQSRGDVEERPLDEVPSQNDGGIDDADPASGKQGGGLTVHTAADAPTSLQIEDKK